MASTSTSVRHASSQRPRVSRGLFALLLVDAVLLGVVELFFLPLRFDGRLLPALGDVPAPLTPVLAMVTTPLLVVATAKLVRPGLAWTPLALWVLTLLVVGLFGPGGDLVLVEDWRALLLLAGGALPAAMVLGGALGTVGAQGSRRG